MKLSEIKGKDRSFDVLCDLIDPVQQIVEDGTFFQKIEGKTQLGIIKILLKEYRDPIVQIMAILDGVPVEEYEVNLLSLPKKIMEILSDDVVMSLFPYAEQTDKAVTPSGSASENIEGQDE